MGPCTFLVTSAVTSTGVSTSQRIKMVWAEKGLKGFYPGGTAIAFRQATNWASRQGFTEGIRHQMQMSFHGGDVKAKLSKRCGSFRALARHACAPAAAEQQLGFPPGFCASVPDLDQPACLSRLNRNPQLSLSPRAPR